MMPFERILMPTDFSELATYALQYACHVARKYNAELHLLHVVSPAGEVPIAADGGAGLDPGLAGMVVGESIAELVARKTTELRAQADDIRASVPKAPIVVVRPGVAREEIVRYAAECAIDLIVIGSHGRGVVQRILLGSTSKWVLEHVAQPVLMVPLAAQRGGGSGSGAPT